MFGYVVCSKTFVQNTHLSIDGLFNLLQQCTVTRNLALGQHLHNLIILRGFQGDSFLGTHLIRFYATVGTLQDVKQVFTWISNPSVYVWYAVISAHNKFGEYQDAVDFFCRMQLSDLKPDDYVRGSFIKACTASASLEHGQLIHSQIVELGPRDNIVLHNGLIAMYMQCGRFEDALNFFCSLGNKDVVTWTSIIEGCKDFADALEHFRYMHQECVIHDDMVIVCLLKMCSNARTLNVGKTIHAMVNNVSSRPSVFICNSLVDMYTACGVVCEACKIFANMPCPDIVTWNSMIVGLAKNDCFEETFQIFSKMLEEGMNPNVATYVGILKACFSFQQVVLINTHITEIALELDKMLGCALMKGYITFGALDDAESVFNKLQIRDAVAWTTLLLGYAQHGYFEKAIQCSVQMQCKDIDLDIVSCVAIVKACSNVSALQQGELAHAYIVENGFELDIYVASALTDMYIICGSTENALNVFKGCPKLKGDIVTWNVMMTRYVQLGDHQSALKCFQDMQYEGVNPDEVTFLILHSVIGHKGKINADCFNLTNMMENYGFLGFSKHYSCLVDSLGRAGWLTTAQALIKTTPFVAKDLDCTSFLTHCGTFGNAQKGNECYGNMTTSE